MKYSSSAKLFGIAEFNEEDTTKVCFTVGNKDKIFSLQNCIIMHSSVG